MNRISTIQGHGQPGCRRAKRGGAAADSMAALLKRVFIFIALMLTTASGAWADVTFHKVTSIGVVAMAEMTSVGSGCSFDAAKAWVDANQASLDKGSGYTFFVYSVAGETYNTVAMQGSDVMNGSYSWDANTLAQYHQYNNVVIYALGEAPATAVCNDNFVRLTSDVSEDDLKKTIVNATDEQLLAFVRTLTKNGNPQFVVTSYDQSADTYSIYRADTQQSGSISYADLMSQVSSNSAWIFSYLKLLQPYFVTLAEGTEDADQWQAKVGTDGEFKVLPVEGIEEGKTVTIQYNGTRRIKSITAVQTAAAEEQQEEAVDPMLATPLTMECLSAGTIVVNMDGTLSSGMQYAVNGGTKTKITTTTTIEGLTTGDKVQFYGVGTSTQAYGNSTEVKISGGTATVKVYGNIMSLLDEDNFATKTNLAGDFVFYALFKNNTTLTDASELLLPATTLAKRCYLQMFYGCTALTAAPALPATTLANQCYQSMFRDCSALTAAPELPAPALTAQCYNLMFYGCSKLATVTCKATNISATQCLNSWLDDAGTQATLPTLYVDPSMTSASWNNAGFTVTAITQ